MSNFVRVQASLQIQNGNLFYQSQPTVFTGTMANVTNPVGPTPGAVTCAVQGTQINLSALHKMGGLCKLCNTDPANFVTLGPLDPVTHVFYPMVELGPGEVYVVRLSRKIQEEQPDVPGTGTFSAGPQLWAEADTAPVVLQVEAFDP